MFDASMAFIAFGLYFLGILGFTGAAIGSSPFSEVFYAYSSAAANNGSAMASLQADTPWFNCTTAAVMLLGRFGTLVPVLAFAGAMAGKKREQGEASLFPVSGGALLLLLFGSLIVLGIIVFLPGLMFGPLLKTFQLLAG
jgi:K+-transporting ATPase ATPase A chain